MTEFENKTKRSRNNIGPTKLPPTIIRFNPKDPDLRAIRDIAQYARLGKIVAFPTETVYGIGVPASKELALERLYQIKGRDRTKPMAYHIGDWDQLAFLSIKRNPAFRYLTKRFWPGPLTLVVETEKGEKIGIRYPKSLPACTLIASSGEPFIATSANRSGEPSPKTAAEAVKALGSDIDFVIDAGPCEIGVDSTVVDVTTRPPEILREGVELDATKQAIDDIESGRVPRKRVLVVCTGNSCRSPMAAGLLIDELKRRQLDREVEIATCGILARDGGTATAEAIFVMKNREIDISGYRTRSCRREDVLNADLIIAMSQEHYDFLTGLVPGVKDKIKILNIRDPIGQGIPVYEEVVKTLEEQLKKLWHEIVQ